MLLLLGLFLACALAGREAAQPYQAPLVKALFVETFQQETEKPTLWKTSDVEKYSGEWRVQEPKGPKLVAAGGIPGDKYLIANEERRFFAISRTLPGVIDPGAGKKFILQYEFRPLDVWDCSGGYLKLLGPEHSDPYTFSGETPYVFMFGPDRCGSDSKVHFILQRRDPSSGELVEHHMTDAPEPQLDIFTHHYQLVINMIDDTFEIYVDQVSVRKGSFFTDFEPPLQRPRTIDDPKDVKPSSWVDEETIADPSDKQPADWNNDAPEFIPDPAVSKPVDWDESAEEFIEDPGAEKPDDWDDEEDGLWIQPKIPNPVCQTVGCGAWSAPLVPNPQYKGKWVPRKIPNPAYKGKWVPRQIPNPEFHAVEHPSKLSPIAAVGIEMWGVQWGSSWNNIVIGRNEGALNAFANATWTVAHASQKEWFNERFMGQKKQKENEGKLLRDYPWIPYAVAGAVMFAIGMVVTLALCMPSGAAPDDAKKDDKKKKKKKND